MLSTLSEVSSFVVNKINHRVSSTILIASPRATTETFLTQNLTLKKRSFKCRFPFCPLLGYGVEAYLEDAKHHVGCMFFQMICRNLAGHAGPSPVSCNATHERVQVLLPCSCSNKSIASWERDPMLSRFLWRQRWNVSSLSRASHV